MNTHDISITPHLIISLLNTGEKSARKISNTISMKFHASIPISIKKFTQRILKNVEKNTRFPYSRYKKNPKIPIKDISFGLNYYGMEISQ